MAAAAAVSEEPKVGPGGYEMTTYYVGFLYRGAKWTPEETPETRKLQEGHMANIQRMGAEGKLVIAGPFMDNGDLRGLYVFRTGSAEEAKALVESDPAVKAGLFVAEMHPWWSEDIFKKASLPFFSERKVSENISTVYKLIDTPNSSGNILYCWVLYLGHDGINIALSINNQIRSPIIVRDVSC